MVVLVLAIGVPVLVGAAVLTWFLRRKVNAVRAAITGELQHEPAVRGPESAIYRGSTGDYPKVFGNGVIVLTATRLIFRKFVGVGIDVQLADVTGVTTSKVFNRAVVGNRIHLVVQTRTGDVGYFVTDTDAWAAALTQRLAS